MLLYLINGLLGIEHCETNVSGQNTKLSFKKKYLKMWSENVGIKVLIVNSCIGGFGQNNKLSWDRWQKAVMDHSTKSS